MGLGIAVALFAILFSGRMAALMAERRGEGLVAQYTVLIAVMASLGGAVCMLWAWHAPHEVTPVSGMLVGFIWLSCAYSSTNYRVNPGIVIFALMATIFVALAETQMGEPLGFWSASLTATAWVVSGWLVGRDHANPGLLALVLIATIPFLVASPL